MTVTAGGQSQSSNAGSVQLTDTDPLEVHSHVELVTMYPSQVDAITEPEAFRAIQLTDRLIGTTSSRAQLAAFGRLETGTPSK